MNKHHLLSLVKIQIEENLKVAIEAAANARQDAAHEQSKAETQYDSLGTEMAYLADGHNKRIAQLQKELATLSVFSLPQQNDSIGVGHLVKLVDEGNNNSLFIFILPVAGGYQLNNQEYTIQVVTKDAPIAEKLLNRQLYDEVSLDWLNQYYEIVSIQ